METEAKQPQVISPTLEYAQRRSGWVSRHRKKLVLLAFCIAIAGPIWWNWQPIKQRILWHWAFRQAAAHQMPAKAVDLYIDELPKLLKASYNSEYVIRVGGPAASPQFGFYLPVAYRVLNQYDSRLNLMSGRETVAFMGVLKRPDGTPRLVIVNGGAGITADLLQGMAVLVLPIPGWTDPLPPRGINPPPISITGIGLAATPVRWRSGVADTNDSSHIVFEFVVGPPDSAFNFDKQQVKWEVSERGTIDAHLQNDDSITFALRGPQRENSGISVGTSRLSGDVQTLQTRAGSLTPLRRAGGAARAAP